MSEKEKTKKENRRSKQKYPALKPQYNLKIRYELFDQDYIHKLTDEEKEWLNRFNEEFNNANFNHKGEALHDTAELKKSCYDRNNARNRDVLAKARASGTLIDAPQGVNMFRDVVDNEAEDRMINRADLSLFKDRLEKGK